MDRENVIDRRSFIGGALAAGVAVATAGQLVSAKAFAQGDASQNASDNSQVQYGFMVRGTQCIECNSCVEACRLWSRTPEGEDARRELVTHTDGEGKEYILSLGCMHCAEPSCMKVCPAGAIKKGDGGIVTVDKSRCIGCKYCYQACPYGVPNYNSQGMDKCDCCLEAGTSLGEVPNCVKACKVGALRFGKVEDFLSSGIKKAKRVEGPNQPSYVFV